MPIQNHTTEHFDGSAPLRLDRNLRAVKVGITNGAGGGAGAAVTVAVAFTGLPAAYGVLVAPNQDATAFVSSKTATGFNVTLTPRLAASTLASGTFDVFVYA